MKKCSTNTHYILVLVLLLFIQIGKAQERVTDLKTSNNYISTYNDFDQITEYNGNGYFVDVNQYSIEVSRIEKDSITILWKNPISYPEIIRYNVITSKRAPISSGIIYSISKQSIHSLDLISGDTIDIIQFESDTIVNSSWGDRDTRFIYEYDQHLYLDCLVNSENKILKYNILNKNITTLDLPVNLSNCHRHEQMVIYEFENSIYGYDLELQSTITFNDSPVIKSNIPLSINYAFEKSKETMTYVDTERYISIFDAETSTFIKTCHQIDEGDEYVSSEILNNQLYTLTVNVDNELWLNSINSTNCEITTSIQIPQTDNSFPEIHKKKIYAEDYILIINNFDLSYIVDTSNNLLPIADSDFYSAHGLLDLIEIGQDLIFSLAVPSYDGPIYYLKYNHNNKAIEKVNFTDPFDYIDEPTRITKLPNNTIAIDQIYNDQGHHVAILSNSIDPDTLIQTKASKKRGLNNDDHKVIYNKYLVFDHSDYPDENKYIINDGNLIEIENKEDLTFKVVNNKYQYFTRLEQDWKEYYLFNQVDIDNGSKVTTNTFEEMPWNNAETIILNAQFYKNKNEVTMYDVFLNQFITHDANFPLKDSNKYKHLAYFTNPGELIYYDARDFKVKTKLISSALTFTETLSAANNTLPILSVENNELRMLLFDIDNEDISEQQIILKQYNWKKDKVINDSLAIYTFYSSDNKQLECIINRKGSFEILRIDNAVISDSEFLEFIAAGDGIIISHPESNFYYHINTQNEATQWNENTTIDYEIDFYCSLHDSIIYEIYSTSIGSTTINTYDLLSLERLSENTIPNHTKAIESVSWHHPTLANDFFVEDQDHIYLILHSEFAGNEIRKISKSNFEVLETWDFSSGSRPSRIDGLSIADSTAYFKARSDDHHIQWYRINNIIDHTKPKIIETIIEDSIAVSEVLLFAPNPTSDNIRISRALKWLNIYNMEGTLVKRIENIDSNQLISLNDYPTGIYLIEYQAIFGKSKIQKIVKTNSE